MSNGPQNRRGAQVYNALKQPQPKDQALAAMNGFGDSLPFGLGNGVVAALGTIRDYRQGMDVVRAWQAHLAKEQANDRNDAAHMATARLLGQGVGTAIQLGLAGSLEAPGLIGARMAEHAPLIAREVAALAGGGAGMGVAGQGIADVARRQRAPLTDYLGAALGGAAGGVAAISGSAGLAGAVDGATATAAQSLLRGQAPAAGNVMRGAVDGGVIGGVAGGIGRNGSNSATRQMKGKIGETASQLRSAVRGVRAEPGGNRPYYLQGGGYTRPDHLIYQDGQVSGLTEAKFGGGNKGLTKRQRQARDQFGDQYRVDHFLPRDVGAALGTPAGLLGAAVGGRFRNDPD